MSATACETVSPVVLPSGRICAWCYPRTPHAQGHGICDDHKHGLLLDLHLVQRDEAAQSLSPKENQQP